jgi:hypothetical protein
MSKNIFLLPTDKLSRLCYVICTEESTLTLFEDVMDKASRFFPQHLYIISDEEIKEGDWFIYKNEIIHRDKGKIDSIWVDAVKNGKKIILTTDQDLIKDGVQAIDDEFLEWFVKNPSCEYVETYSLGEINQLTGESGHYKYEIIISQEESKQETLEEAAYQRAVDRKWAPNSLETRRVGNEIIEAVKFGAKWQAERSYSEEDMKKCWDAACAFTVGSYKYFKQTHPNFKEWFEQFKKKV